MTLTNQSQDQETTYNREDEYIAARRSAAEAVLIGRETLEATVRQGEQLQNAENMADETEYKLDRATRLLKGMTWSGWFANKFSKDVAPPEYQPKEKDDFQADTTGTPIVYDDMPEHCYNSAQAVQNYHANLQVLDACEDSEQKATCKFICDNMYHMASKKLNQLHRHPASKDDPTIPQRLQRDLNALRRRQLKSQREDRGLTRQNFPDANNSAKSELFQGAKTGPSSSPSKIATNSQSVVISPVDSISSQQEEHLDFMSEHLDELESLANNLNSSLQRQAHTLESLDDKSESMLFKSDMVTRRADRLIQKKTFRKVRPEFVNNYSIQHLRTGKYLAVSSNNSLVLSEKFNETCVFGIWKRQGKIFGMQNKYSRKWAGQSLLGNLACSATSFDRREEWDADEDWSKTPLLCASAGWGTGAYILVDRQTEVVSIGGGGLADKKTADDWCIKVFESTSAKSP